MKIFYKFLLLIIFCSSSAVLKAQIVNEKTLHDIALLEQEKAGRTPAQKKLASQLLQAIREFRGEQMVPGVNLDRVNVNADAAGNLEIDIKANVTAELLNKISALGGKIISSFKDYQAVRAAVNLNYIETIASFPEVIFIQPAEIPQTNGSGTAIHDAEVKKVIEKKTNELAAEKNKKSREERDQYIREQLKKYFASHPLTGSIASEGDRAHRADEVRNVYGYEGQNVRIGVLSDSYNATGNAPNDVLTGNLPGATNPSGNIIPVTVLQEGGSSDEGRAMLQLVHDIAPKAQLFFATGNGGQPNFATNIRALRTTYNCDVIIDDLSYFAELVFQDGTVAAAVNDVTAAGAMYFSSAANSGSLLKGTAGVYEADFNDNGAVPVRDPAGVKLGTLHNFGTVAAPQTFDLLTATGSAYYLKWSDPGGNSTNDYDLFLLTSAGAVRASSTTVQVAGLDPYEQVTGTNSLANDRFVVFKTTAASVRTFHLNANRGQLGTATNGQTGGHASAVNAFCMAATPAATPFTAGTMAGPFPANFTGSNVIETFSSDGPRRIYYNQDGTLAGTGVSIATGGGVIRNKPDLTAADGISTTFANASGLNAFYGTSASAPNAGAIAAQLKSGNPLLTAAQIRTILINTAIDIEGAGYDVTSGYGIINAFSAAQAITAVPTLRLLSKSVTEGTFANNNGVIDPGETGSKVVAQLNNPSGTSATSVTAILSTPTTGVTITQNTASYGTLASGASSSNSGTPFRFDVGAGVPCGSDIHFILSVTYGTGGSSPQIYEFEVAAGRKAVDSFSTTLGTAQPGAANYIFTTGNQTGRLARTATGTGPACGTLKANPGLTFVTGARVYDSYRFTNTNPSTQCVRVAIGAFGGLLYSAAYTNAGFVPANPSTNFLADPGIINGNGYYSFNVAAGDAFTVVVHEVNPGTAAGAPYNLTVNFSSCTQGFVVPVRWLSFTAQEQKRKSLLTWKVAEEGNVSGYNIEYSTDGRLFDFLTYVPATAELASEKTYSYLHNSPVNGNNYYRIRQVDRDGRASMSSTQLVKISDKALISVLPNPTSDVVKIRSGSIITEVQLLSMNGQLIRKQIGSGTSTSVDMSDLATGQYILRITTESGVINEKIQKK